jgi:hypothetical protein
MDLLTGFVMGLSVGTTAAKSSAEEVERPPTHTVHTGDAAMSRGLWLLVATALLMAPVASAQPPPQL